jgi:hypothetical protein
MPLSGRKVKSPEERKRREERENNTIKNGHYVGSAVACTPLGPINLALHGGWLDQVKIRLTQPSWSWNLC